MLAKKIVGERSAKKKRVDKSHVTQSVPESILPPQLVSRALGEGTKIVPVRGPRHILCL